jgi:hypothetical protein
MAAPEGNQYAVGNPGGGRPTLYNEQTAELAYRLCMLGLTDKELGIALGVSETTINAWKQKHEEFSEALTRGKVIADADVAVSLYKRATGYSHEATKIFMPAGADAPVYAPYTEHYPPDTGAALHWLANRQPAKWRNKQEHEHTGNVTLEALFARKATLKEARDQRRQEGHGPLEDV